ncbi:MAG: fluoride efflux transporter CrcB [Maricaulaceae bacterium]|jgi:CrcB protein
MNHILLIAAGGAVGATGRHLVGLASLRFFGPGWPWGTLLANILGGLAMGLLVGWLASEQRAHATELRYALGVGLLGGFTTFSAFSLEVVMMIERKAVLTAAGYVGLSVVAAVGAVMLGLLLSRSAFG